MLSCHPDPFSAFVKDLQLPGCEVHLYKGPNVFGGIARPGGLESEPQPDWWEKENVYFLPGVRVGLMARAADSDVWIRGMFTLDFDIRKEMEKAGKDIWSDTIEEMANKILISLEHHPMWGKFRYVVMSGNGMHIHYFGQQTPVDKEKWVNGMKDVFDEVNAITPIPCDTGCGNAGRIMRMPGSWNVKDPLNRKPVEFLAWMPDATLPPLDFVLQRGALRLQRMEEKKSQAQAEFAATGQGSDVIELINKIPIEQVVRMLLGCTVRQEKKDGGLRFADEKGEERGFFKHHEYNIIVHEGTSLFAAPEGKGYNCLGLVKAVLGLSTHDAIQWFCERCTPVRDAQAREKEEWAKENASHDVVLLDEKLSQIEL